MSLLLRRRALLAAGQEKEGGGENDGKYLYMVCRKGANTYRWSASVDYGVSFQANILGSVNRAYSCSNAFDCNGNLFYQGNSYAYSGSYLPFSNVTSPSQITASSATTFQGFQPAGASKAWFWSTDGKRCIRFSMASYNTTYATTKSLQLWDNYGSTPTTPQLSFNSFLTVPSWATESEKFPFASGPYLKFNSDTLQVGFLSTCANVGTGLNCTCSFTRDGGQTWIDIPDIFVDNSQSLGMHGFVSSHISNDGKHIGFVYHNNSSQNNTLYVSHDYGATFNSVTNPSMFDGGYVINFETSAKFKTWYISTRTTDGATASIWKSVDQGQSWIKIRTLEEPSNYYPYEYFHCNDAGDKLVTVENIGTGNTSKMYYSHDGGETWTYSGVVNYPLHGSWNFWMCRDSYNTSSQEGG